MLERKAEYTTIVSHPHIRFVVTPNCNLLCKECQPGGESYRKRSYYSKSEAELITPKEVQQLAKIALKVGFAPIKITGGELLTREDAPKIVELCKEIPGAVVNLGTNGLLLEKKAQQLQEAGIDSLNVGLNSLNKETYKKDTGVDGLSMVIKGLERAKELEIPVNINFVLMKQNFKEFDNFIEFAEQHGFNIRVLPLSNLGDYSYWSLHYVSPAELENHLIKKYKVVSNLIQPWSGVGTPMSTFSIREVEVRIINPENGVYYSGFCQSDKCGNYPCIDGIWALRIDSDGNSKYCFFPRSGREPLNYLEALRGGQNDSITKRMEEDFKVLSSAQLGKKWSQKDEERKYK